MAGACTGPPAPPGEPTLAPPAPGNEDREPKGPGDPKATPAARELLAWLTALPQRQEKRVVSGQQIGADARADYDKLFHGMTRRFGRTPALLGASFDGYWKKETVGVMIDHWRAGGLVTMDLHRPNPFLPQVDPESYRVGESARKDDLSALLADAPPSQARSRWRADLEMLGDIVQQLDEAGVTLILRPLHELNGNWFWWGLDRRTGHSEAVRLYRDMHAYLTGTRGLHNVLWAYSPARPWDGPRMRFYPGDDIVDIMGPTSYGNALTFGLDGQVEDISDMLAAQRPMALLEVGSGDPYDGNWKATEIIDKVRTRYPQLTMFNCWHGWVGAKVALMEISETDKLMNDPWVISLETVDWRR
nr:glycosyl hydrolase [Kibdelosporangium phytohabitans]